MKTLALYRKDATPVTPPLPVVLSSRLAVHLQYTTTGFSQHAFDQMDVVYLTS
jgi:hypothetical protein